MHPPRGLPLEAASRKGDSAMTRSSRDAGRRRFLGAAALSIAGSSFGAFRAAATHFDLDDSSATTGVAPPASFGALKQIDAGVLSVSYAEAGPADGAAVILLHGWPYDIHTYVDVAPLLATAGYRVIVPYLRGYGSTRFLSSDDAAQRPAGGAGGRRHRVDGRARRSTGRSSAAATGVRGRPTSSRRSGRSAARPWCRSAAT